MKTELISKQEALEACMDYGFTRADECRDAIAQLQTYNPPPPKKKEGPYEACHTSKDDAPYLYGIEGPGNGLGYHAWYGYPQNTFTNFEDAEKVARMMNLAYMEGMKARSRQIRELLN